MVDNPPIRSLFTRNNLLRVTRFGVFVFGIYSTGWNLFSFIGVAIGLFYYLCLKDPAWRRHGVVLAWVGSIMSAAIILIGLSNSYNTFSIDLTYVTIGIIFGGFGAYAVILWVGWKRAQKGVAPPRWVAKFASFRSALSQRGRILFILAMILAPVGFWWGFNVNWNVMIDNNTRLLWVHAPTTVDTGKNFSVTVEAWDAYERLSATYTGTISFGLQSYNLTDYSVLPASSAQLPGSYTFTGQALPSEEAEYIQDGRDNGLHVFTALIDTPGIHYLLVNDSLTGNVYWSNPIVAQSPSATNVHIYWGDLHSHSILSDGSGTADQNYYFARHVACLDYAALTDHGEVMLFTPFALQTLERASNLADDEGSFVAFEGLEWTNAATGHYTLVFSGNQLPDNPPISFLTLPNPFNLWADLDQYTNATGCQVLAIPHHCTKLEYLQDWTYFNPKYVKFAEVSSVHGECLFEPRSSLEYRPTGDWPPTYTPGASVMDALIIGCHFALNGDSDGHDGHLGHSLSHTDANIGHQLPLSIWTARNDMPYPGSITAVHAANLTRAGVFAALENAQIYANSDFGRPYLDFAINGTRVSCNSTLIVPNATATREITVTLAQDGAPAANKRPDSAAVTPNWLPDWKATVQILKNGNLLANLSVTTPIATVKYDDSAPVTGTSYGVANCTVIGGKYYINQYSDNPVDPATLNTRGQDFYVIRVVGDNGRTTYAGVIWVAVAS
ncbi:MAG TPA: DUF3604 domain-containing protein [Candidatus Lokiarchaeia archaeon]|nr:DUF3604 domain-containing protein [Candidatus Lokiarchaeia archaeon]